MNQLQLYIEHTYLFRDFSEVWRDDTPLTPEDILELDAYCMDRNIELIPSISTCSHLDKVLRTQSYKDLCELDNPDLGPHTSYSRMQHHTVNICDPAAMEMVKEIIAEYRRLFIRINLMSVQMRPLTLEKEKAGHTVKRKAWAMPTWSMSASCAVT